MRKTTRLAVFAIAAIVASACGTSAGDEVPDISVLSSGPTTPPGGEEQASTDSTRAATTSTTLSHEDAVRAFLREMAQEYDARSIGSVECNPSLTVMAPRSFSSCTVGDSPPVLVDVFLAADNRFEWEFVGVIEYEPPPYHAPDPASVELFVDDHFAYYLDRYPSDRELTYLVDYILDLDYMAYEASLEGYEWDVPARFTTYFEDRYEPEMSRNRRVAEARITRDNLMSSICAMDRAISGDGRTCP